MMRAIARIDLGAIERNCVELRRRLTKGAALCAVVKADGYGHGAAQSAAAALRAGAEWLAVATADEASALRNEAFDARILVMGALCADDLAVALAADADVVVWRESFLRLAASRSEAGSPARVHVKLDTGMGRLGTKDPDEAVALVAAAAADDRLELAGFMTHFATADEPGSPFFDEQLARFTPVAEQVKRDHPGCVVHAANSAAVFRDPAAHFDMARCGIAVYGLDPFHEDPFERGLTPALALESYVADVKPVRSGESVGYGRSWSASGDTRVAVLPIGYGDGYRRGLSNRAEAIIAGRRFPLVGTISMDNVTVEVTDGAGAEPGAVATLIGHQGKERILTEELARRLDTINYEVTCGITSRVPRVYDGEKAAGT
jgi:alanine racemase